MRRALLACLFGLAAAASVAQEIIPHHQDRPPGPALSPPEAIRAMTVPEDFSVELVASEPDIVNPVAMTFDERGRIWITESLEYPRKAPGPGKDRVKILEDTDGDGKADKFSVFAEGLNIPSGIAVGYGGVWVANSPDILFYPDADRDGKPGPPQVVVSGFGRTDTHELPNSLTWGPDGYLYGLNGVFNHSHVRYAKENPNFNENHPGWQFNCAMFRIHPVTREFEIFCEGTSNPWGIAFDHEGSAFVSACVIDHLWHLVRTGYYHRQGGPYPPFTWKIESIVKHKHQKAAYCGLHYYDSDAYPEPYRNKLYMGNIHGNCINVDKLQRDGSTYFATGEPDFLTANDAWFMPVAQKTGPDGCLYILDWYDRYHCYQDANRDSPGIDRLKGRLYRVRYKDTPRAGAFDLKRESDDRLFERLKGENGFFRDAARHELIERRRDQRIDRAQRTIGKASKEFLNEKAPLRLKMLNLSVASALNDSIVTWPGDVLSNILSSPDPLVRAWGVRIVGNQPKPEYEVLLTKVRSLAGDPSPDVRLQVAITIGRSSVQDERISTLLRVLAASGDDKLIPHVVWQNLYPRLPGQAGALVEALRNVRPQSPGLLQIVPRSLERLIAEKQFDARAVSDIFTSVQDAAPSAAGQCLQLLAARIQSGELRGEAADELRAALSKHLVELAARTPDHPLKFEAALTAASWNEQAAVGFVERLVGDSAADANLRARGLAALAAAAKSDVAVAQERLLELSRRILTDSQQNKELIGQVMLTLGKVDHPRVAEIALVAYPRLPADVRPRAIELLTQRAAWGKALVGAIAARQIQAEALNVNQVQRLLALNDKELTAAVNRHWGTIRTTRDPAREQLVAEMRKLVRGTKGDPHRGIEVFNRVCGQCHKIYGQGQEVGPDITSNGRASLDQLLSNVFDPSLVIGAIYQARTVVAADGRIITGLLVEDSPQRIVLKVQGGKLETIARADVEAMKISELSMMPEGLEKQLQPQEIADLFAYIGLDKPPTDPTARPLPSGPEGKK
jgi:putative membrane-bound dehydrogenase-like protein